MASGSSMTIAIQQDISEYKLNEDLEIVCTHIDHTIEPPCCNGTDCGCHGQHSVVCHNPDCTGITDSEADELIGNYIASKEENYGD
jgi:hypothetical protein